MKYAIVDNIEAFEKLENDWKALYQKCSELSAFQSFEFNYYSWKLLLHEKGKLFIVTFYEKNKIAAIFPTYIDKKQTLRFINDTHVDFCDIISDSTAPFKLFKTFKKVVCEQPLIRSLSFINMSSVYTTSQLNYHFKTKKSLRSDMQHATLSDNIQFSHLNSSEKSELKRIQKQWESSREEWKEFDYETITSLKSKMIDARLRSDDFLSDSFVTLLNKLFENDLLKIFSTNIENETAAVSFMLNRSNNFLFWIDLYNEKPYVNLINYISCLKGKSGVYSFGRGTYNYKMNNFQPTPMNLYRFSFHKNWMLFFKEELTIILKSVLKSVLRGKQY